MSRRASLLAKQEKRKPRVRFPDELVFLDNMKGNDIQACHSMLRRASIQMDINGLDNSGLTPLHNAVLEGNLSAVKLLVQHGAEINRKDSDTWTPLHAACANGEADIARYLLSKGANRDIKTNDGERPLDLCDARDFAIISVMLESDTARKARLLSSPDEELEFEVGDNSRNDNRDEELSEKQSGKKSSSADSSPEASRKSLRNKNDIKNANADLKNQTSSLVKGIANLKTGGEKTSPSKVIASTTRQRISLPPPSPKGLTAPSPKGPAAPSPKGPAAPSPKGPAAPSPKGPAAPTPKGPAAPTPTEPIAPKAPKPAGQSILKKSPQHFRTVAE